MSSRIATVDRHQLANRAYAALREQILAGEFEPGQRLVEHDLAERLGVSRVPVREALARLREDGLLEDAPNRGLATRVFTAGDIADIYNFRLGLEPVAIRLVTRAARPVDRLQELIEEMEELSAKPGLVGAVTKVELRLHQTICDLSGNRILSSAFAAVAAQIQMAMAMDNLVRTDTGSVADEHRGIVEAISAGDDDRAAAEIVDHILSTVDALFDRLATSADVGDARARLLRGIDVD